MTLLDVPGKHWELDDQCHLTQEVNDVRRGAAFIILLRRPRKRTADKDEHEFVICEGKEVSTQNEGYDVTAIVNGIRWQVDQWRELRNPS